MYKFLSLAFLLSVLLPLDAVTHVRSTDPLRKSYYYPGYSRSYYYSTPSRYYYNSGWDYRYRHDPYHGHHGYHHGYHGGHHGHGHHHHHHHGHHGGHHHHK